MTDSYHFNPNFDHIAYMERQERERLNQLFDSYYSKQAKVLNPLTRTAADVARQSIGPFPSGATLKVAGDKIVGRVEAEAESEVERAVRTILNSPMKRRDNLPPAPLPHFNQRTPFDSFGPEFKVYADPVTSGFEPTAPLHTSPTTDSAYPAIAGLLRG